MTQPMFDRTITAIQKVGLPAVVCLFLLFGGRELLNRFLDQQAEIFAQLVTVQREQVAASQKQSDILMDLARNQDQMRTAIERLPAAIEDHRRKTGAE